MPRSLELLARTEFLVMKGEDHPLQGPGEQPRRYPKGLGNYEQNATIAHNDDLWPYTPHRLQTRGWPLYQSLHG